MNVIRARVVGHARAKHVRCEHHEYFDSKYDESPICGELADKPHVVVHGFKYGEAPRTYRLCLNCAIAAEPSVFKAVRDHAVKAEQQRREGIPNYVEGGE